MQQMQEQLNRSPSPPLPTCPRLEWRQYYCTHGLCYHSGDCCRTKKEGHRDTATLQNKMGGNTRVCSTSSWRLGTGEIDKVKCSFVPNTLSTFVCIIYLFCSPTHLNSRKSGSSQQWKHDVVRIRNNFDCYVARARINGINGLVTADLILATF